ncbi:MAG: polyribonucleotide nucleotidyltransferase [Candidatus Blackburnbacteria bacterium RIFCSPHIGHO2_01_FULL_43_15b]|uniref:Polyribonucleotide nucleotidyltransferase n=1 Tax=Candidatus Blackburnbacteria bacterium RIFCSPHIGHO2_01_FULL_43_15b TaxID=1797513 RepID=A0A1G1V288_9BACT|nr:MAG: polyribonucleotide nucleotidyltransferase [Candidatus Blackburnbacteria bacterium RIFCSPHIGHO2_01_FULL_43_15b]
MSDRKIITQEIRIGDKVVTLEHGRFAEQANSAIVARLGDTMVFASVVSSQNDTNLDYFPLTVDYTMRLYAGGRIKGSRWVKREGRPSDEEILTSRLIDRSIRPLFPKSYKKEVQVITMVLSVDGENDPAVLSMVAVSAALATSSIPWKGPVGSLRIGEKDGIYFANPTDSELTFSDMDLVMTANKESIFMIEAGAQQVPEEKILGALDFGFNEAQSIIGGIEELTKKAGKKKDEFTQTEDEELIDLVYKKYGDQILEFARVNAVKEGGSRDTELIDAVTKEVGVEKTPLIAGAVEKVMKKKIREQILSGTRLDGRKHDQIRPLSAEVGILPRTHGSAVFARGQTQVVTVATLGSPRMSQLLETAEGEETKHYIHHYNFPPYSTGETGRVGAPGRREIGHGALAERALIPVIPSEEEFPYTIHLVSEVMSSNGSTSMASTCGSTLSLMDAGVPLKAPISGIAMGLVIEGENVAILSDIMGIEDGNGDMDFKVTGSKEGVTAIQLDVKTSALTLPILERALKQAREGRIQILEVMTAAIDQPRGSISQYAPKVVLVRIPVEKIGEVIGPGGRVIKKIMVETGTQLDVEDDGSVTITGVDPEGVAHAREWVEGLVKDVQPGEIYEGEVVRIQPFGAFVQVLPGKDGLVHVSDMAEGFVQNPEDVVSIGDKVQVRVKEVDNLGRINLSMRMDPATDKPREERGGRGRDDSPRSRFGPPRREAGEVGRRSFGPRRGPSVFDDRRGGSARGRGDDRGPRRPAGPRRERSEGERGSRQEGGVGGPHFPASRLVPSKRRF